MPELQTNVTSGVGICTPTMQRFALTMQRAHPLRSTGLSDLFRKECTSLIFRKSLQQQLERKGIHHPVGWQESSGGRFTSSGQLHQAPGIDPGRLDQKKSKRGKRRQSRDPLRTLTVRTKASPDPPFPTFLWPLAVTAKQDSRTWWELS